MLKNQLCAVRSELAAEKKHSRDLEAKMEELCVCLQDNEDQQQVTAASSYVQAQVGSSTGSGGSGGERESFA